MKNYFVLDLTQHKKRKKKTIKNLPWSYLKVNSLSFHSISSRKNFFFSHVDCLLGYISKFINDIFLSIIFFTSRSSFAIIQYNLRPNFFLLIPTAVVSHTIRCHQLSRLLEHRRKYSLRNLAAYD